MQKLSSRVFVPLAIVALSIGLTFARAAIAADENSRLIVQVMTDETKKPVASAHVVVRFISGKTLLIKNKRTTWEAQTNKRGEIIMEDIPKGRIRVQVIARGYQTYGNEIDVSQPEETVTILLKPPAKQVSAY